METIIGKGINERRRLKPIIFIDAGIHAREWIAPATAIYIIDMDRLWRKTRSPQADGCFGVDPNRNFDIDFGDKSMGYINIFPLRMVKVQ
ncbi:hypothetical protein KUTeg_010759 [Tegillarca granosa]|uniref:Peptidase M14 domain-containing protein n=1 Tax=Tegillarca granosa TaxID=220873 RepID=A0ABQ9F1Y6_TEGGR|nr:hypothetical protein KUTeg_010759 [Tegillarca granosa]